MQTYAQRSAFRLQEPSAQPTARNRDTATRVQINWNRTLAETTAFTFGVNDYGLLGVERDQNPLVLERIKKLGLRLVRLRCPGLVDRWINPLTSTWDEATVHEALDRVHGYRVVLNLPCWPSWMKQDAQRLLCPSEYVEYARLCASLVELVNHRLRRRIVLWELMYELDDRYVKAGKEQELWRLYNFVAVAMKQQDPTIKVGGPGLSEYNPQLLASFMQACRSHIDFVSWHDYTRCPIGEATTQILESTNRYRYRLKAVQELVSAYLPGRRPLLLVGECNLDFQPHSLLGRADSAVSAVWLASTLKHLAETGIDMVAFSHLQDNHLGLLHTSGRPKRTATVLGWMHHYLSGKVCWNRVLHPAIEALSVRNLHNQRALLLINKSSEAVDVTLEGRETSIASNTIVFELGQGDTEARPGFINRSRLPLDAIQLAPYALKLLLL